MQRRKLKCSYMDVGSAFYVNFLSPEEKPFFRVIIEIAMNLHAVCPAGQLS